MTCHPLSSCHPDDRREEGSRKHKAWMSTRLFTALRSVLSDKKEKNNINKTIKKTMKRTYKYITLAALALGLAACTQDDDFAPQQEDIVKIASANIATEVQTRVNTLDDGTLWENTDRILLVNNSRDSKNSGTYTYNGTAWVLTDGLVLYASSTSDFTAYYPASEDFTLPTDQSDEAKIKSADRMTATADAVAKGDAVALIFERENAMVTITPSFNSEFDSGATISSLQIAGITPYHPADAGDYKAIIAPNDNGFTVTVSVEGVEQPLTANTTTQIEAGKHYTFNLTVGKGKAEISSVSVQPWADGGTLEGDVAEECTHETVENGICTNCGLEVNFVYDKITNTYTVYTEAGLQEWYQAAQTDLTTNLTLAADITLPATTADGTAITVTDGVPSGSNWTPIGTNYNHQFTGTIDGGGHTLSGLRISSTTSNTGFIGYLGTGGAVKNLTLANAVVHSTQYCIGIVVGVNLGTMENCHVETGSSVAMSYSGSQAGGIVGNNSGLLMGCTHAAAVKGTDSVGGIAGLNGGSGSIIACANTGTVDGTNTQSGSGHTYACWSTASNDLDENYGRINDGGSRTACYIITTSNGSPTVSVPAGATSTAAANIANAITAMNAAIDSYNASAAEGKTCPYTWQAGTDGYPTLVKSE